MGVMVLLFDWVGRRRGVVWADELRFWELADGEPEGSSGRENSTSGMADD